MSLVNGVLKLAISTLNLLDVYKALTARHASASISLAELGQSKATTFRTVRDGVGTPVKQPHTRYRIGSSQRKQQLRGALSLVVVWALFQTLENSIDSIATYLIPFYGSLKLFVLLWILLARTAASSRIVAAVMTPVIQPYEGIIDRMLAAVLALFLNVTFLMSLPLLKVGRETRKFVDSLAQQCLASLGFGGKHSSSHVSKSENAATRQRVPAPPTMRGRRRRPSGGGSGGGGSSSAGDSAIKVSQRQPSSSRLGQTQRTVSLGMGRPQTSSSDGRAVPGIRTTSTSSTSHVRSQAERQRQPLVSDSIQVLQDLPPPPTAIYHSDPTGGFAFIPTSDSGLHGSEQISNDTATLPLSPFTPSILPGGFGPATQRPKQKAPLRMPAAARASQSGKKTTSSASNGFAEKLGRAKTRTVDQDAKKAKVTRKERSQAPRETFEAEDEKPLFLGPYHIDGEEDRSAAEQEVETTPRQRRRKGGSSRVSPQSPSSKRPKLEVFEDDVDEDGSVDEQGPARRTRGASAAAAARSSRANSVAADAEAESKAMAGQGDSSSVAGTASKGSIPSGDARKSTRPPLSGLTRSTTTRSLAKTGSSSLPRSTSTRALRGVPSSVALASSAASKGIDDHGSSEAASVPANGNPNGQAQGQAVPKSRRGAATVRGRGRAATSTRGRSVSSSAARS
ncbi:unnamed protein product [Jaminaea pallidilutea]